MQKQDLFVSVPVPSELVISVMAYITANTGKSVEGSTPSGTAGTAPAGLRREELGGEELDGEGRVSRAEPRSDAPADGLPDIEWSVDDLVALAAYELWTPRVVSRVLDLLASSAGEWLTTTELMSVLAPELRMSNADLKGTLSALTRHVRKHYRRRNWPMEAKWGPDIEVSHPAEMHYRLDERQAAIWRAARQRVPFVVLTA